MASLFTRLFSFVAAKKRRPLLSALALLLASALLVLPVPGVGLDFLWALLLVVSAAATLTIRRASPAFPALLLVVTLMRLTLTLASARAILQSGDAGLLVEGAAAFLLGNNPWTAWGLFLVVLVTQLVVVVRGNERIAEVRARFALDAMPGRQLSIDADLRGGSIQSAEAQRQRAALSAEGELFGALDGAMKFARGEQVALVVLVLVCVVGGVASAVFQRHSPVMVAFSRFSLLGISVGLLAELSAFAFAAVTGIVLTHADITRADLFGSESTAPLRVTPWSLTVGKELSSWVTSSAAFSGEQAALDRLSDRLRADIEQRLGLRLPDCEIRVDPSLPPRRLTLCVRQIAVHSIDVPSDSDLAAELPQIVSHCAGALRRNAAEFLGIAETQALLDALDSATVLQVVPSKVTVATLCEVLRRLVSEGVNIRDLKAILDALALSSTTDKDPAVLAEMVRGRSKRALTQDHAGEDQQIAVLPVDPQLEELLRAAISRSGNTTVLALAPSAVRDFVRATQRALSQAHSADPHAAPVVLTAPDVRRFVRGMLEVDLPDLAVLAPTELLPTTALRPLATINVQGL